MTTELNTEKAATTLNYKTNMLLREGLRSILGDKELHTVTVLIKDVKLIVKIWNKTEKESITNTVVPQGDCLSSILSTLYLAKGLSRQEGEKRENMRKTRRERV